MVDLIKEVLRKICPVINRLEICCAYGCGEGGDGPFAGLDKVKERRVKGELMMPVLIYGFDPEERIRAHEGGSILNAPGVFYLKLPARLSDIEPIIERAAYAEIPEEEAIDEKSFRDYAVKKIRTFKHRLDNVCTSMEMNANRARKELEKSPRILPKALFEFKPTIVQNLLSEYMELNDLIMRLDITDATKIPKMMDDLLSATRKIKNQTNAPSDALGLAFRSVEFGRTISKILEQAKEL